MKKLQIPVALLLVTLFVPFNIVAQEFRATIVGRVVDPAGAAVPGAQISAINVETSAATRTTSTDSGDYVIPALSPGRYRIEVEQTGFKKFVQAGVTLQVQERPTIDITLETGGVDETVTVTSDASPLEASTGSRGEVISGRTLVDLPLNGRNAFALAGLTPGVTFTVRGQASTFLRTTANNGISGVSISGGQPRSNEALLDGVPNTGSDGLVQFVPSVDATQEFKVQTNSFDSEFGRFTGGVINASIKSGTNDINGSLFEFFRNSRLNARDPFARDIPQFGYNLFGGSVGGPVFLPRFGEGGRAVYDGRGRTFFFFNFEGSREGVPRANTETVPTAAQRAGDFSGSSTIIYDPATTRRLANGNVVRDPFPGNRIPANRISPLAQNLLSLFPLPNAPGLSSNYLLSFKDPVYDNGYIIKIDHNFSERHKIFGRYSFRRFGVGRQGAFKNPVTGDTETRDAPGFAFDDTYTLDPKTVLNFRYGFSRFLIASQSDSLGFDLTALGFPQSFVTALPVQAIPQVSIFGFTTISSAGKLTRSSEDSHTARAGVTRIEGRQTFRFGGEYRLLRSNNGSRGALAAGGFEFNSVFTRGPNPQVNTNTQAQALASFLLGLPSGGSVQNNASTAEQAPYYGFYFQDDLRVNQKLTLNLGLRYEFEGENTERFNRFNRGFAFDAASPLEQQAIANYTRNPIPEIPVSEFDVKGGLLFAGVDGQPRGISNLDRNNFSPRIGAAYALNDKTVLRGGYGIFYGATTQLSEGRLGFSISTPFVASLDGNLTPFETFNNPFRNGFAVAPGASQGLNTLLGQNVSFVDPNRKQPYAHQYQVSIQRELPGQTLIDAAYVGSLGRDIAVNQQINGIPEQFRAQARQTFIATGRNILSDNVPNPFFGLITSGALQGAMTTRGQLLRPFPQFTSVTQQNISIGSSRYDALQLKISRRFVQGFGLTTAYTFSKQLERTRFLNDQDTELVNELNDFDTPHRLVVSTTYELPFGRGQRFLSDATGFVGKLVEGFQFNVIYQANSGVPLTITNAESNGISAQLSGDERTVDRWFDNRRDGSGAFRLRQTLELVSTSRLSDVRSAGRNNFDFSLFKTTSLTEGVRLQFRAEAFNAFNTPEFSSPSTPNSDFNNPNFGQITTTNTFARQIQFALKLLF